MHVRFHAVCVKSPSNITVHVKTKCSWALWMGSVTHQFNKYTSKLQSVAHKSVYLETDHPRLFCKSLEEKCILGKSPEHLLLQDPFRHWNLRHKPGLHTLEHGSVAIDLLFWDEVLDNRLVSSEWIPLAGNPGDNLSDVVETITKEGLVPLHLWSWCISHEIDLHPDGLVWASNVFQKAIFVNKKKIGWSWNLDSTHSLHGYKGLADVTSVNVVKSLHNKFTELCVCMEFL